MYRFFINHIESYDLSHPRYPMDVEIHSFLVDNKIYYDYIFLSHCLHVYSDEDAVLLKLKFGDTLLNFDNIVVYSPKPNYYEIISNWLYTNKCDAKWFDDHCYIYFFDKDQKEQFEKRFYWLVIK